MNGEAVVKQKTDTWALVIEDNALHLIAVTTLLRELNVSYKRNTTGVDVVEQACAMQPLPGVILLDMDLPYSDSVAICQMILAVPVLKNIPVLAMGGDEWLGRWWQLQAVGFSDFIRKPFAHKQFKRTLQSMLSHKGGRLDEWQINSLTS
jgi:CheY-like chemotaxis protein